MTSIPNVVEFDVVVGTVSKLVYGRPEALAYLAPAGSTCTVSYLGLRGGSTPLPLVTLTVPTSYSEITFTDVLDWRTGLYSFVTSAAGTVVIAYLDVPSS